MKRRTVSRVACAAALGIVSGCLGGLSAGSRSGTDDDRSRGGRDDRTDDGSDTVSADPSDEYDGDERIVVHLAVVESVSDGETVVERRDDEIDGVELFDEIYRSLDENPPREWDSTETDRNRTSLVTGLSPHSRDGERGIRVVETLGSERPAGSGSRVFVRYEGDTISVTYDVERLE